MRSHRIAVVALALLATGCTSDRSAAGTGGPTRQLSLPGATSAPAVSEGTFTRPVPTGTKTVVVTFLRASDSFATPPPAVLYRRTVQAPSDVERIIHAVNALRVAPTATEGCVGSSVNLRLDFFGAGGLATFDENSPCFRSVLIVNGRAGPTLASNMASQLEQMFGLVEATTSAGQPSLGAVRPSTT